MRRRHQARGLFPAATPVVPWDNRVAFANPAWAGSSAGYVQTCRDTPTMSCGREGVGIPLQRGLFGLGLPANPWDAASASSKARGKAEEQAAIQKAKTDIAKARARAKVDIAETRASWVPIAIGFAAVAAIGVAIFIISRKKGA